MARGNTYTCATCGKEYEFCPKCALTKPSYEAERYCSKDHEEIFTILSKNGCQLATAVETLDALKDYSTTGLKEDIQKHIDSLQPKKVEVEEESEAPAEEIEEVETKSKKISFRTHE